MRSMSSGVIHTPRVRPHDVAVLPTGTPDRRRVDDRGKLLEVIDEQPVEECLIAVLQRGETDVLLEVVSLAAEMFELEGDLLLDGHGSPRQQAAESERRPLVGGESSVLVDRRAVEQLTTPRWTRLRLAGLPHRTDPR